MSEQRLFTAYEQFLFSKVVALAERAGKHVDLLVVPSSEIFPAIAQTAAQLYSSMIIAGSSSVMSPEEQARRLAGQSADGWTIMAVHDSKESWERFRDTILMPRIKQGISGGFTTPPQETTFEVHNLKP